MLNMVKFLHIFLLAFLLSIGKNIVVAQTLQRTVVASSAETLTGPNPGTITLSYVVGETVNGLLSNAGNNLFLTTGFLQPDNDLQQLLNNDLSKSILLYPNPVSGNSVKLAFNNLPDGEYVIDIIDPTGHILETQTTNYRNNNFFYLPLDISQIKLGVYFIRVNNGLGFNRSVKLIKI